MLPVSRRIFLYWFLLLVPTLVVGGGAILLLRREQARLAEQGAYAEEARRAAITARARLIAENVELLVGDVQTGLLDTLAAQPGQGLEAFLDQWEKNNPLVRTTFRSTAEGRLLRPAADAPTEAERGFIRRFSREFVLHPPWSQSLSAEHFAPANPEKKASEEEATARKEVTRNVAQIQAARRDVQELANSSQLADAPSLMKRAAAAKGEADRQEAGTTERERANGVSRYSSDDSKVRKSRSLAAPASAQAKDEAVERRGWRVPSVEGRLHLLGWVQPAPGGEVRGVEVELTALVSRLAGALPAETGSGEGYALRDDQGRILHQMGAVPRTGGPAARVPLAGALLPGWDVVGYLTLDSNRSGASSGFFGMGVLLVAIFVTAILAGGSLLLWQARRSEEEALQKTSFVANVSHEFKTPLTTIRLYAELLEEGRLRDAAQGKDYLRTISRETQRLARLVNNALDFSRLEQGQKKYAHDRVDLTAELTRLLDTHGPRVAEAGLKLGRALPTQPLFIATDRDAVEQIVINLLDNACKYGADGGEVIVMLAPRAAGGAELKVADRGPGVPQAHVERIFEKFHRVEDALTAEKTGAGLGLSIARQLARGLGGDLRYTPRVGGGAEFVLDLP